MIDLEHLYSLNKNLDGEETYLLRNDVNALVYEIANLFKELAERIKSLEQRDL